ncbi:hypothetical protein BDV12DRAFT_176441 [Aspergillus spectabilis]
MASLQISVSDPLRIFYPVVIIGAGAAGIAAACRLKSRYQFDQFRIFERHSGIGGTWWANRYPGVACDVPTLFYSFSFAPNYQSKTIFPTGENYLDYLYAVVERADIAHKIQLNSEVVLVKWVDDDSEWELEIKHTLSVGVKCHESPKKPCVVQDEIIRAKIVISAVGVLTEPNEQVEGRNAFLGQVIHSARWPSQVDLAGQDVVVVGSGCSAAQIVPALLQTQIRSLTQIIRSAPWIVPRMEEPGGKELYAKWAPVVYRLPFLGYIVRITICCLSELLWFTVFQRRNATLRHQAEAFSLAHVARLAPQKYHRMLTPAYQLGCKRRVYDNEWLRSMHDPRLTLVHGTLHRVHGHEVTVLGSDPAAASAEAEGKTFNADTLILTTGFKATEFLHSVTVIGRHGLSLQRLWTTRGGAHAYMGAALDGFPNFFVVMGPNTFSGHTSVMMAIENSIEYILTLIQPVLAGDTDTLEAKPEAVQAWTRDIHRDMGATVFEACASWYNNQGAYNSVLYPRSQLDFYLRCRFPRLSDWNQRLTARGQSRQHRRQIMHCLAVTVVAIGVLYAVL